MWASREGGDEQASRLVEGVSVERTDGVAVVGCRSFSGVSGVSGVPSVGVQGSGSGGGWA
jgi:hypothetical protein